MEQQNAWPGSATDLSILTDSQLEKEQENLHTEKEMFLQQKANFEEERKLYTEAVIRLGKEVLIGFIVKHVITEAPPTSL